MTNSKYQLTFLAILLSFAGVLNAQTNLNYPYSISGIGLLKQESFHHQRFMGGLNTVTDSSGSFSMFNPASLSTVTLTDLEFGLKMENVDQFGSSSRNTFTTGSFEYIAMGVPISLKKGIGLSLSLQPVSMVEYFIQNASVEDSAEVITSFEGSGGLNKFSAGIGFKIYKGWSLGFTSGAIFGNTIHNTDKQYIDNIDLFSYRSKTTNYYSGWSHRAGVQYSGRLSKNLIQQVGATYTLGSNLSTERDQVVATYSSGGNYFIDTVLQRSDAPQKLSTPSGFSVGYSVGNNGNWFMGIQAEQRQWSAFQDLEGNNNYYDQTRLGFGGYFQVSSYADFENVASKKERRRSYWKIVRMYYGASYNQLYLNSFSDQVTEVGINFGLGLPIIRSAYVDENKKIGVISRVNIGIEYVQRGSNENGLIKENMIRVNLGTNFNDKWFTKRKYQ